MRVASVFLPEVRIELARARLAFAESALPLAVVIGRAGTKVGEEAETALLGNTKLDEVSREARALGIRAGDTIAAARAKSADLCVRVVAEGAVEGVLARVAEAALAFGATVSFDVATDVAWVDVTGCAHLHEDGEVELAARLESRVRSMHHACRVAIADGSRVASAVARFAPSRRPIVVPPGHDGDAMRALPVHALPIDEALVSWLAKLGLHRVGDLDRVPRRSLGARLGASRDLVMMLLRGEDRTPLVAYVPPEIPEERAELEYGIVETEALLFVAKRLCDGLAARLAGRVVGASKLALVVSLDRAFSAEGHAAVEAALPAPIADAAGLFAVVRAKVERFTIPAPILAVTLRATELARIEGRSLDLFLAEAKADRALPRLVAELAAEMGDEVVGTLSLGDSWLPEKRTVLVPYAAKPPRAPLSRRGAPTTSAPEPSRVLHVPIAIDREVQVHTRLARIAAVEWWREGIQTRDFATTWSDRERKMAWIEIDRATGKAVVKGWMD